MKPTIRETIRYALSEKPNLVVSATEKQPVEVVNGKEPNVCGVTGNGGRNFAKMSTGEYVSALSGSTGRVVFEEMRRSDPKVGSVLKAITLPIRSANWHVEPASGDALDVKIAETIEANLLRGMTCTWDDVIRHALLMLPFGFSIVEKVWEYRPDGVLGIRKLAPRLPVSVMDWKYDKTTGEMIGPEQADSDGTRYVLPIEKLLVFTNDREGDNWEGISILRTAYKPWFIKSNLEKIDAIKHDRYGVGVPMATPPQGVSAKDQSWADAVETLENLQAQEQSYLIKPNGWDMTILTAGAAAGTDVVASIKYHDEQIGKAMLAQFIDLGTSEFGSRALGGTFVDLFMQSIQAYADYICEVVSRFLIREYVGYNWAVDRYPILKCNGIKRIDYTELVALVGGGIVKPDAGLESVIRQTLELPQRTEDDETKAPETNPSEKTSDDDEGEELSERRPVRLAAAAPELRLIDAPAIGLQLDNAEKSTLRAVLAIRDEQRAYIIEQTLAAKRVPQINVPKKREMYEALMAAFHAQRDVGREQVRREMVKQTGKALATRKRVPIDELYDLVEEQTMLEVEGAADKLKAIIIGKTIDARRIGLDGDALRKQVEADSDAISDVTWEKAVAGAVNGGWGAGRDEAARQYESEIDYVYRSAILDSNTCPVCSAHDGDSWAPGEEEIMPDRECEGGDNCRCINIYVMKAEGGGE